jgi:hypothetical protein
MILQWIDHNARKWCDPCQTGFAGRIARVSLATHESWKADTGRLNDPVALDDRKFVVALARGLEVLRVFTPNEGFLGNQEIAVRRCRCSDSTANDGSRSVR